MTMLRQSNMKSVIKEFTNLRVPKEVVNYLCQEIEKFIEKEVEKIDDYSESIKSKTLVLPEAGLSVSDIRRVCSETSTLRASSPVLFKLKLLAEEEIARRVKSATDKAEEMKESTIAMRHFRLTERKWDRIIEGGQFLETQSVSKFIERNIYPKGVSLEAAEIALSEIETRIDHALAHLASWNAPEEYDGRYDEIHEIITDVSQVGLQRYLKTLIERAGELSNGEIIQAVHMMDAASYLRIEAEQNG